MEWKTGKPTEEGYYLLLTKYNCVNQVQIWKKGGCLLFNCDCRGCPDGDINLDYENGYFKAYIKLDIPDFSHLI